MPSSKNTHLSKWLIVVIVVTLFSIGTYLKIRLPTTSPSVPPGSNPNPAPDKLSQMPFIFLAGSDDLINFYNQTARDTDYIYFFENNLVKNPSQQIKDYQKVKTGKILQAFASVATAENNINLIKNYIDGLGYDLEKWDKSAGEGNNIEAVSQTMAGIAKNTKDGFYISHLGIQLASKNRQDPASIEHMAQYSNAYALSIYPCLETMDMAACVGMARDMAVRAKKFHSDVQISIGISLEKNITLEDQVEFLKQCSQFSDSIGVFIYVNRPDSVAKYKQLIHLIRG